MGWDILALVLVGAGHDEAGEPLPGEFLPQRRDARRDLSGIGRLGEGLEAAGGEGGRRFGHRAGPVELCAIVAAAGRDGESKCRAAARVCA